MSNVDRIFREYKITKTEQEKIMNVMDKYREDIANGIRVSNGAFEADIIAIFGGNMQAARHVPAIEYHFCEYVAKGFMEEGRWVEVFSTLYGEFPKYKGMI